MTAHLLLVTLGPVQDFIAQARRTRDLWFGSHLLSELSRAAARALVGAGAELVFPPLSVGDPELLPCDGPLRPTGHAPLSVANKLLAVIAEGGDPEGAAREARKGAQDAWRSAAASVRRRCRGLLAEGIDAAWNEQIETFLEFNAAWSPLGDAEGNDDDVRRRLEEAVAARKHLRDFPVWTRQRGGVPKSSLDGARETVLAPPARRAPDLVRRYRIAEGEQLDAVGLIKRTGAAPEQFVPIGNVALASWIEAADRLAPDAIRRLADECREIGVGRIERTDLPWTRTFAFDAEVFLMDRWDAILKEAQYRGNPREWGKRHVLEPIFDEGMRAPHPYVACLAADGDRMGDTLRRLRGRERRRAFARELSRFADKAHEIIEQEHRGVLVYAGGDDVLAFVGVEDALGCADALRRVFAEVMQQALAAGGEGSAEGDAAGNPTLSVGLGIGHLLDGMAHLLSLGRSAEQRAKSAPASYGEGADRDALAILVDKRSGGDVVWRGRWEQDPVAQLRTDAALLEHRLSSKKIFEIQTDIDRMPSPDDLVGGEDRAWAELLAADTARTLARAGDGEGVHPEEAGLDLDVHSGYGPLRRRIARWVTRMLVARHFVEARRASEPGPPRRRKT